MSGNKKAPKNKSTPFEHSGNFSVGAPLAGESLDKKKNKKQEEEEEVEEENEEEEEEEEGFENMKKVLADLPAEVARRVRVLRKQYEEFEQLDEEYQAERAALEKKFLEKKRALYEVRSQIVSGEIDPPAVVIEGETDVAEPVAEGDTKGVPSYWLNVLASHPTVGDLITEDDDGALEHLTNITCDYDDEFSSYTLNFHFSENEYFSNAVLTKTYYIAESLFDENPTLEGCEGCEIQWKEGKNLCVTVEKKKQKAKGGKNKGQVRTVTKEIPKRSFFNFFKAPEMEAGEEDNQEENDDEDGPIHLTPDEDYDVGHSIRTAILPKSILYFLGEINEGFDFGEYGDEEEDDDEEDDDEDGGDEDEGKGKKKGFAKKGAAGNNGQQQECKQN